MEFTRKLGRSERGGKRGVVTIRIVPKKDNHLCSGGGGRGS